MIGQGLQVAHILYHILLILIDLNRNHRFHYGTLAADRILFTPVDSDFPIHFLLGFCLLLFLADSICLLHSSGGVFPPLVVAFALLINHQLPVLGRLRCEGVQLIDLINYFPLNHPYKLHVAHPRGHDVVFVLLLSIQCFCHLLPESLINAIHVDGFRFASRVLLHHYAQHAQALRFLFAFCDVLIDLHKLLL